MRLLVTRAQPEADRTAAALLTQGHEVVVAPLLRIEPEPDVQFGPGPYAAVAITSANAMRALAMHSRRRDLAGLAVYTVGRRSAEAAREAGFAHVISAGKDVRALAQLIQSHRRAAGDPVLYLAGQDRAGDLGGALAEAGIAVHTVALYRAVKAAAFPLPVLDALRHSAIHGVLHFSRRTAEAYIDCAQAAGLQREALAPVHYCISATAAAPLAAAGAAQVQVAPHPDEHAVLGLLAAAPRRA